jgi:nucleotide-binding universal stress UspA family protein
MTPIRTILHPTDFSENSELALSVARDLAGHHRARVVILHVSPVPAEAATTDELKSKQTICRDALETIKTRSESDDGDVDIEVQLKMGDIASGILDAAVAMRADLIVIGAEGCSAARKALMGSVADAVMRGAACPVLAVSLPQAFGNPERGSAPRANADGRVTGD